MIKPSMLNAIDLYLRENRWHAEKGVQTPILSVYLLDMRFFITEQLVPFLKVLEKKGYDLDAMQTRILEYVKYELIKQIVVEKRSSLTVDLEKDDLTDVLFSFLANYENINAFNINVLEKQIYFSVKDLAYLSYGLFTSGYDVDFSCVDDLSDLLLEQVDAYLAHIERENKRFEEKKQTEERAQFQLREEEALQERIERSQRKAEERTRVREQIILAKKREAEKKLLERIAIEKEKAELNELAIPFLYKNMREYQEEKEAKPYIRAFVRKYFHKLDVFFSYPERLFLHSWITEKRIPRGWKNRRDFNTTALYQSTKELDREVTAPFFAVLENKDFMTSEDTNQIMAYIKYE